MLLDQIEDEIVSLLFEPEKNKERIDYLRRLRDQIRPATNRQSIASNEYAGGRIERFNKQ